MKLNWANSIKTYLKVLPLVLLTIFFIGPFITSSYAALIFEGDFETGDLGDFDTSGIPPTTTSSLSRVGTYAMESWIEPGENRSEIEAYRGDWANVGEEYWYGFSIFLPEDFIVNYNWEILAQWHGYPDFNMGEDWRNPVMALYSSEGRWSLGMRWDSKRNTFESGKRVYDGTEYLDLGSYKTGVWTDWVFHIKWSYESDGFLEIWKNGKKVLDRNGPNCFNDAEGPYFKMGIYTGGVPCTRIVYHDEFRMADANSTYADVAPGGNVSWVNIPPTADAGSDIIVDEGEEVPLDGLGSSDPDDGIVAYFWEQTGGPEVDILDPTDVQTSFIAPDLTSSEGVSLTFELTVQDSGGLIASDTCVVNVTWLNTPPTADAGQDQTVFEGDTVTLDGSASMDPDDGIAFIRWTQTSGTPVALSDPAALQPKFIAPEVGGEGETLIFQLTVTGMAGLASQDTCVVIVNPTAQILPPTPDIKANGLDGTVTVRRYSSVSISISIDPGDLKGETADLWLVADAPWGRFFYVYRNGWQTNSTPFIQYPLDELISYKAFNISLPKGDYFFHFAIDDNADGIPDGTWLDTVSVKVW